MAEEKKRQKRRTFTREFKADVARMCRTESIADVSQRMGLFEKSVRLWVKQAEIDAGKGPPEALTTDEREENRRLLRQGKLMSAFEFINAEKANKRWSVWRCAASWTSLPAVTTPQRPIKSGSRM